MYKRNLIFSAKNLTSYFGSGLASSRESMGLPYNWNRVDSWLNFRGPIPNVQLAQYERIKLKNSEIPQLENYHIAPGKSFWDKFPSNSENNIVYELNPDALSKNLESVKEKLRHHSI